MLLSFQNPSEMFDVVNKSVILYFNSRPSDRCEGVITSIPPLMLAKEVGDEGVQSHL